MEPDRPKIVLLQVFAAGNDEHKKKNFIDPPRGQNSPLCGIKPQISTNIDAKPFLGGKAFRLAPVVAD